MLNIIFKMNDDTGIHLNKKGEKEDTNEVATVRTRVTGRRR